MGVRAATAAASTGVHKYSTVDNVDVWTGNTAGITSVVDDSCANVSCHNSTYSANAYRSPANPTYVRYWNNTLDCYSCHAYDGLADSAIRPGTQSTATADWIATGSHDQHINKNQYATGVHELPPERRVHSNAHKSGSVNLVANFGATRYAAWTGGVYDTNGATGGWAAATPFTPTTPPHAYYCGNVNCHSTGEPRGAETIAYPTTTQWTVAGSGNCGTCHTITGSALTTNVHEKHTGPTASTQYNYACQTCHFTVVDATPAIIAGGYALHVNGSNTVAFNTNLGTYSLAAGGTVGTAGGTCTATYCHSQGLDWSAPYTQTANAPATEPDWDIAAGTLACSGCHGNPPAYANPTTVTPGAIAALEGQLPRESHQLRLPDLPLRDDDQRHHDPGHQRRRAARQRVVEPGGVGRPVHRHDAREHDGRRLHGDGLRRDHLPRGQQRHVGGVALLRRVPLPHQRRRRRHQQLRDRRQHDVADQLRRVDHLGSRQDDGVPERQRGSRFRQHAGDRPEGLPVLPRRGGDARDGDQPVPAEKQQRARAGSDGGQRLGLERQLPGLPQRAVRHRVRPGRRWGELRGRERAEERQREPLRVRAHRPRPRAGRSAGTATTRTATRSSRPRNTSSRGSMAGRRATA